MARKTQQDAEKTRDNILNTALEIIYEKGYARSTFVDIAKEIQLSKGAIYHHFNNKPELFLALGMQMEKQIDAAMRNMISANPTLDDLQEILYEMIRVIAEDPQLRKYYSIVFHRMEWTAELQPTMDFFDQLDNEMRSMISGILKMSQRQGMLSADVDTVQATYSLMAIVDGFLGHCLFESEVSDTQQLQIVKTGLSIFFKGLQVG